MKLQRTANAGFAGVLRILLVPAVLTCLGPTAALSAQSCAQASEPIATDRPDTTNSSVVVPVGSLQNENGINLSRSAGAPMFDATNSRYRLGLAPCFEFLIDVPNDVTALRAPGNAGFTDVTPAFKWQISPIPGKFDLSLTMGAGLPTGASRVVAPGVLPYLQFPWSIEIGNGFAITGMETNFFYPDDPAKRYANQSTFVLEREFEERYFLFAEYIGDFPLYGGVSHLFNSGGGYRITPNQQIDFHLGFGLNRNAPAYVFGVGYSFRLDGLFKN